ncbi:gas vesicle synthesis family protein [Halococcus morrhuae DSM 1307]|uniref:Gas vesicle synthesis family protein n=1 Tax=Halococcus morrhuae DSM 1307 TaxID=931277 RepID=M0MY18_HALMO|nr:gas vesicle protein [Halococcus morrhuae]EMA49744.1 gas vesicle synthesis family protein [Halococcus morrhuae DSM 1307]
MADLDPNEHTIDELRDELDDIDDRETLEALREAETDGEDRTGAKEAIDERLDTVTDDGNGDDEESDGDESAGSSQDGDTVGIVEIRDHVRQNASDLIGRPLDGIVEIERNDDGWRALTEIIERRSVPDTQDILGRYALELDDAGHITGYRRLERYRRGDTKLDEEVPAGGR